MPVKRTDGLGPVFLPFHIAALITAILLTVLGHAQGLVLLPVFLGWYASAFLAWLLLYYACIWVYSLFIDMSEPPMEDHPHVRRVVVSVIGHLNRLARIRIHLSGEDRIPNGRFLVVSNHRSGYDPIATIWALRKWDIGFITKPENLRIPIAGPMIFRANYLPIDRENPREAIKTVNAAAKLLQNDVVSIGVYPEGTRGREADMLPFHNGVFKIAQKANVPIVVLSVRGTEDIKAHLPLRHTDVYLDVCAVLPAAEIASAPTAEVSERVRAILTDDLTPAKV